MTPTNNRMASGSGPNICFYSNKCAWSSTFIKELANTPYKKEFTFICVDASPNRPALPGWLKKVPTLVIKGENEPRTDSEVMNWLFERRLREGGGGGRQGGGGGGAGRQGGAAAAGAAAAAPDDLDFYNPLEMGGMGNDPYSFLDSDGATSGNGGARIQHSFEFLNGAGGGPAASQGTTTITNHNVNRSKKEELFDAQMEEYQRKRAQGMPQMVMRQ